MALYRDDEIHAGRIRLLTDYGWLATTSPAFINAVLSRARWKKVEVGERVTNAGECKTELIGLAEGVATMSSGFGCTKTSLVHVARAPFWFGCAGLVENGSQHFTSVMRSRGWVLTVDYSAFVRLLKQNKGAWQAVARLAVGYGDLAATVAGDLLTRKSERRVSAILLRCSGHRNPADGPPLLRVPLTQAELATAANLSRNSVVTLLQDLAARDLVGLSRGEIEIKDPKALFEILRPVNNGEASG